MPTDSILATVEGVKVGLLILIYVVLLAILRRIKK